MKRTLKKESTKRTGGPRYYAQNYGLVNLKNISVLMRKGDDLIMGDEEPVILMSLLKMAEFNFNMKIDQGITGDVQMMNRIIRAGGFVEYIKRLE